MPDYVLALDQGTTSSRAIVFDRHGTAVASHACELVQHYPQPGWVEHDPNEIWGGQLRALRGALEKAGAGPRDIAAIGITNQRETAVVWDRATGEPIHRAIVWQSRQTAAICEELEQRGLAPLVAQRTGLVIDPYFSATKVKWILDHVPGARDRARRGELAFGTVDSWLVYRLTGGRVHATDSSNASRTMLYDIERRRWDPDLLAALDVPVGMLPEVRDSSGSFGETAAEWLDGAPIPIAGVAGDQQAALFGQACFDPGSTKNTYGTGCFLLVNTGEQLRRSTNGLLSTIAWSIDGRVEYALEGSVFMAGAIVQWLRDELGLIDTAARSAELAASVDDAQGVFLVPAFTGLGAPYWDPSARGTIVGLTRGTTRAHLVRAALEAIAFQCCDLLECFARDTGLPMRELRVDGGAAANEVLLQIQADLAGMPVVRSAVLETTALGAAYLAGLAVGFWSSRDEIRTHWREDRRFPPRLDAHERARRLEQWRRAVDRARGWVQP
jgi:glycerol kinase